MPETLFEKVWKRHVVTTTDEATLLYIDRHLIHEVTSPQAFEGLRLSGRKVRRPDLTFATLDHNVPTENQLDIREPMSRRQVEALRANCKEFGVTLYDMQSGHQGIVHVIGPELGLTLPGTTIVMTPDPIDRKLDIAAVLEPDADNDGFGDETQDCAADDPSRHDDCAPPETTITKHPKDKTKKKTATFEFSSSETGSTFECSLDGTAFAACTSRDSLKVKKGQAQLPGPRHGCRRQRRRLAGERRLEGQEEEEEEEVGAAGVRRRSGRRTRASSGRAGARSEIRRPRRVRAACPR